MEDSMNINEWIVVNATGGRYLGRPVWDERDMADMKLGVLRIIGEGDVLELEDALDFMSPLRPVQGPNGQMAFTRDPIVVAPDFTTSPIPIYVKPSSAYFCADLSEQDKKLYVEFVTMAHRQALTQRAERSGLSLVGPRG